MPSLNCAVRLLCAAALAVPAFAALAEEGAPPVYLGAMTRANQRPEVKFVLAEPAGGGRFKLTRGLIVEPNPAQNTCEVRPTSDLRMPDRYFERPLYDPAEARSRLAA